MNPHSDRYCWTDSTCIRACIHSGPHLPGCRNCHSEDHLTANCTEPDLLDHTEETMTPDEICAQQLCDCRENDRPCVLQDASLTGISDAAKAGRLAAVRAVGGRITPPTPGIREKD